MASDENPYAPPASSIVDVSSQEDIETLPVSEKWKARFRAIQKAGGPKRPHFKQLSPTERRQALGFNALAYLFGPFYYLSKGMWRKAITLLALAIILFFVMSVLLRAIGWGDAVSALKFGIAAIYASLANADYYRKMVLHENGWW